MVLGEQVDTVQLQIILCINWLKVSKKLSVLDMLLCILLLEDGEDQVVGLHSRHYAYLSFCCVPHLMEIFKVQWNSIFAVIIMEN
jgi:hypothetical protein